MVDFNGGKKHVHYSPTVMLLEEVFFVCLFVFVCLFFVSLFVSIVCLFVCLFLLFVCLFLLFVCLFSEASVPVACFLFSVTLFSRRYRWMGEFGTVSSSLV